MVFGWWVFGATKMSLFLVHFLPRVCGKSYLNSQWGDKFVFFRASSCKVGQRIANTEESSVRYLLIGGGMPRS